MAIVAVSACLSGSVWRVRLKGQMSTSRKSSPYVIVLTATEDRALAARVASGRTEYRDRIRAQIVVEAAHGASNAVIADTLNLCVDTVRTWRRRFATATCDRLAALTGRPRTGRPRVHGPAVRAQAVALACALPAEQDVPPGWSRSRRACGCRPACGRHPGQQADRLMIFYTREGGRLSLSVQQTSLRRGPPCSQTPDLGQ